ncbi:SDR family oxidoreductase [Actinosynnema sp. NPDC020468]|uniref:SDR family NAD(P)-dependent oxidoreductase n=1 Tax=Actinosynnema sp. NPDC020468 TaxID=3154488 RepID=UPI0033DB5114
MQRVVVVTGGGTGIGAAAARGFLAEGATVVAVGRRAGVVGAVDGVHPLVADVTADAERVVGEVLERFGRVDVLVNNAGIVRDGALGAVRREDVEDQVATNLVAPLLLTQAALPSLRDGGVVVNVSTAVGQRGWPTNSAYAATKAGLDALTRSWAVELAPFGVRVNAVAPGAIDTPIADHQGLSPERKAALRAWQLAHTPAGRIGRAEEVARAVVFLASPDSAFITGVVLPVDGGAVVA